MLSTTALQVLSTVKTRTRKREKGKEEERRNVVHRDRSGSRYTANANTMNHFNTIANSEKWLSNEIAFFIFKKEIYFFSSVDRFIITKQTNIDII